ncbi:MAG: hypothetical protein WC451_00115 [Patescibacteria group bacterium]
MTFLIIAYVVFLLAFLIYSASGIYHLWRFGYVGDLTKPAIVIYVIISGSVIILTLFAMSLRSWTSPLS